MQIEELASVSTSAPRVSDRSLAHGLDLFIVLVIFVFFLFNIPRALLYIANHRSQVFQGYLLRSTKQLRPAFSPFQATPQFTEKATGIRMQSLPTLESGMAPKKTWHFPMHFSCRHPAASFTHHRVIGNYTVIQVLLMAGYSAAMFYAAFYASNPFSNPKRIGWVIASQIPFVYTLATKNNVIGLLIGVGYEKLNYLHRHLGRLVVIGANVHALGFIYKWSLAGNIRKHLARQEIRWGIVALSCLDLLGFFSLQCVRNRSYNIFFATHAVASVVLLIAVYHHKQACIPFVIAGSVIFGLDHIVRVIKTRLTIATLQTVPELELTRINVPTLNTGWRAGQHVRLRVLSPALGYWTMSEVHPFTIASAINTEEGLVLMCKKTGKWTRRLYEVAQSAAESPERKVTVMVEGPYGGIGDTTVPNYSGAMIVAGGSGVTFALSAVQDLVLAGAKSRTQVIDLIWSTSHPAALRHFIPLFTALATHGSPAKLRISVFYTRATCQAHEDFLLPPDIVLAPGRPRIKKLLQEFVTSMISNGGKHGAFVGVCGPVSLSREVARTVRTFDADLKKAVGGIHLHEEVFGW